MVHIVFRYKDVYTNGEWREQECIMSSLDECIRVYGLGEDCEYEIIKVENIG